MQRKVGPARRRRPWHGDIKTFAGAAKLRELPVLKQVMHLDDDELRANFVIYGMREVCYADRFVRDMRGYIVRAVLRTLAGDVPQIVCRFDFDKLADEDEAEIYALCDAVFDSIFLDTEFIPGDDEWNERLAAVGKERAEGVLSELVRAAVKAALAFRSDAGDSRRRKGG